jgi:Beta-glucosidase-related glycosidases
MKKIIILSFICLFASGIQAQTPDYKNPNLSFEQRTEDLLKRLTLEEKVSLMMDASPAVERLGIKQYSWWSEALHGVARAGLATVFPQPIGMAASFDAEAVNTAFNAVSDEARAKSTFFASRGERGRYQCLTFWTPTINIFRDPRWGRGMESYGEDPYLTAVMGVQVVKGLQGPDTEKYDKLHACAKHFAVHSGPEWNRHSFDAKNISPRDLYETYLPAFEALVKEGNVQEVMCAYNAFEGEPCCGSNRLLTDILRNKWGYKGIVLSDCGAIDDFYRPNTHKTHADAPAASAAAVLSGTDLNCGSTYKSLDESYQQGLISEEEIDVSVRRLLLARFRLGEMDDDNLVSWTKIPYSVVASDEHAALALDMARKSMTLLQNKNNTLPLKKGGLKIAVMGANAADSIPQWGNYNGIPRNTVTILEGIRAALTPSDKLIYLKGCDLVENTITQSVFNQCSKNSKTGFSATYWNNTEFEGTPTTITQVTTAFKFSAAGATVFAPKVNLTDFSARYESVFTPKNSGEVILDFMFVGYIKLYVNDVEVKRIAANHGNRKFEYTMPVESGKNYEIKIDYNFTREDASLDFDLGFKEKVDFQKTVSDVKDADIVIFAGGISPWLEGEEMPVNYPGFYQGDRTDIELPAVQRNMLKALHEAGKKVIFVNCSGSAIALEPETKTCDAIIQAWYSGQAGGQAVADVIFGAYNPAGRLPVTFYKNNSQLPDFEDYNMTERTYRYMTEEPLFPFGYGLSYTTFEYGKPKISNNSIKAGENVTITVPVKNSGAIDGDEVVQIYLRNPDDKAGLNKALRDFKRINIPAGKTVEVNFELTAKQLEWWNETAQEMRVTAGKYEILAGKSSKNEDLQKLDLEIK